VWIGEQERAITSKGTVQMRPLQAQTDSWAADSFGFAGPGEAELPAGRHEPQILIERIVPKDPYAAWLEQREAQREFEDRPRVRWVHRQRRGDGRAIAARRL
jgi:hypothetical protein